MASPNIVTSLALNEPQTLISMMEKAQPVASFLYDRYCYTNTATDIFRSESILIDYQDKAGRRLAPLVHEGYKTTNRRSYYTDSLRPARIAPTRKLTVADLMVRQHGEGLFSGEAPTQRAANHTINDVKELKEEIRRRFEYMTGDLLSNNKYTLTYEKSDANGESEEAGDKVVSFIDDTDSNISAYTPATLWGADGAKILDDIEAMCVQTEENGGQAVDVLLGTSAAAALMSNPTVQKYLDLRRMEMLSIAPEIKGQGATLIGLLNLHGYDLNLIAYRETYKDASGKRAPFLAANKAIVCAPGCIRALFGSVTQVEQGDNAFHTHDMPIVPKFMGNAENNTYKIMMESRPLLVPTIKGGWVSANVL